MWPRLKTRCFQETEGSCRYDPAFRLASIVEQFELRQDVNEAAYAALSALFFFLLHATVALRSEREVNFKVMKENSFEFFFLQVLITLQNLSQFVRND
jgi:hypothetical protein